MSVIPLLAASGTIFMDARAHKTIYDGCQVARARGAAVKRFRFEDHEHLAELLKRRARPHAPRRHGRRQQHDRQRARHRPRSPRVAREHGALLYVDDAHGFGVIGERPDAATPYGHRGNSVVKHAAETYENIVLVGGFSKAYSSLLAFIACPTDVKDLLKVAAPPYLSPARRRWRRWGRCSPASTSTSAAATRCARTCTT